MASDEVRRGCGKSSWPELFGVEGELAVETIKRENTLLVSVFTILVGTITQEIDCSPLRVRVWVDTNGIVAEMPRIDVGKSSWPELLGVQGSVVVETIRRENTWARVILLPPESVVTADFDYYRVWVWIDTNGIVIMVPRIG